jgi:hypothetical protein
VTLIQFRIFQLATENEIEAIKYGLVNVRQFQVYVDALRQELKNVMNRLSSLDQELLLRITDIQGKYKL